MEKETQNFMAKFGHVEKQAVHKVCMLREATELVNVLPKMNLVRARELWTKWSDVPAFCTVLCFVRKDGDTFVVDTPLSSALSFYPELALEMLDKGADFRAAGIGDASFLFSALQYTCHHYLSAFEALLRQGAGP